jgi:hypothetical protein
VTFLHLIGYNDLLRLVRIVTILSAHYDGAQVELPLLDFVSAKAGRRENIYVEDQRIAERALGM